MENRLRDVYYNPEAVGGFGSVRALAKAAGATVKDAERWLSDQFTYTLHKPARRRYATRPYRTNKIDRQWQSDLVEMLDFRDVNEGYKYLMTVIDLFSRHAWARPLKSKHGKEVTAAFEDVMNESGRQPHYLQTDAGKEYENRHFQHMLNVRCIKFFTVKSQFKAAVV